MSHIKILVNWIIIQYYALPIFDWELSLEEMNNCELYSKFGMICDFTLDLLKITSITVFQKIL